MAQVETTLTPELAARLLAAPHPKQRRSAPSTVAGYARAMKEGRWRLVPDPILVIGPTYEGPNDPLGTMFNGRHRCEAAITSHRDVPVYIDWDADPSTFDLIDIGRKRSAYQFLDGKAASTVASAARVTLWYDLRFERPLNAIVQSFDLHEVLEEVERRRGVFEAQTSNARQVYEYTSLARSVGLAAFALAAEMGYELEIDSFVAGIMDPAGLPLTDPRLLLAERFRKVFHRNKHRQQSEDWNLLVRALNLHFEGKGVGRLALTQLWPRVAEIDADFVRRSGALASAKNRDAERARNHVA